jgi:hypothetical protein
MEGENSRQYIVDTIMCRDLTELSSDMERDRWHVILVVLDGMN